MIKIKCILASYLGELYKFLDYSFQEMNILKRIKLLYIVDVLLPNDKMTQIST